MSVRSQRAALRQFLQRWRWNSNNGAAMLLAVAALGTAWSSYQASLWGGIQASSYTRSMAYRSRAARASGEAAQDRLLDVALFTRWFEASLDRNPRIVSIYETHFRPSFRDAFDAWRHGNAGLADSVTPFDLPEYHSVKATEAERAEAESMRALEQGERANDTSNIYFFASVLLAIALFFAGALRPLVMPRLQTAVLAFALLFCFWAVVRLVMAPIAR